MPMVQQRTWGVGGGVLRSAASLQDHRRDRLHGGGVLAHGLGALGHGVLGELARKRTADSEPPNPQP